MSGKLKTGLKGEALAIGYLVERGFEILERNWRHRHLEIDIIASRDGVIHFVEVKTRKSLEFGYPEESVGHSKISRLIAAGAAYLYKNRGWTLSQYDIISILLLPGKPPEFLYIQDVYL